MDLCEFWEPERRTSSLSTCSGLLRTMLCKYVYFIPMRNKTIVEIVEGVEDHDYLPG